MSVELKIKEKHLALEPAIIKKEEAKLRKKLKNKPSDFKAEIKLFELQKHRKYHLGVEARATHLARAYIAGKPYKQVEASRKPENEYWFEKCVARVIKMVAKYGCVGGPISTREEVVTEKIKTWLET